MDIIDIIQISEHTNNGIWISGILMDIIMHIDGICLILMDMDMHG